MQLGKNQKKVLKYLLEDGDLKRNQYRVVREATIGRPTLDETSYEVSNANVDIIFSQTLRKLKDRGLIKTVWRAFDFKWLIYSRENIDAKDGPSDWYPHGGRPQYESDAVTWTGFSIDLHMERKPDFIHYLELTEEGREITHDLCSGDT